MNSTRRRRPVLSDTKWRASSYSGGQGDCAEVADDIPRIVPVRDSKRPTGPVLHVRADTWNAFLSLLR